MVHSLTQVGNRLGHGVQPSWEQPADRRQDDCPSPMTKGLALQPALPLETLGAHRGAALFCSDCPCMEDPYSEPPMAYRDGPSPAPP